MHQASGERLLERAQLAVIEARRDDLNLKISDVQGPRRGLSVNPDGQALGGEAAEAQILRHVLPDATPQRGEQQLGRGHALVGGAVFRRLVQQDSMVARFRSELCAARVLQRDFQRLTPDSAWIECKRRAIARCKGKAGFCWSYSAHQVDRLRNSTPPRHSTARNDAGGATGGQARVHYQPVQ